MAGSESRAFGVPQDVVPLGRLVIQFLSIYILAHFADVLWSLDHT